MNAPSLSPEIRIFPDGESLRRAAADEIVKAAQETLRTRKVFTLALSGGSTPRPLYTLLGGEGDTTVRARIPWPQVHLFWTDERPVHADHPDSNYGMVRGAMLEKLGLTRKQVHRVRTEGLNPAQAATEYQRELKDFFGQNLMLRYDLPRFDMVLLGMGADGHVAGLFPGSEALKERRALVVAPKASSPENVRITLTLPVLNMAVRAVVLVAGRAKAEAVKASLEGVAAGVGPGAGEGERWPARLLKPNDGRLLWLLDREAASLLK